MNGIDAPVLIAIFNRPDKVRSLIASLAESKPKKLYIAADGPRKHVDTDGALCAEARDEAQKITWPCDVRTNFSDKNLGVDPAIERAIDWLFENEAESIILEDDCVPGPDFLAFAQDMLARYRADERVMMVSGDNFQHGQMRGDGDYYFSHYPNTWGWATWRRAWQKYDTSLSALPDFIKQDKITSIRPRKQEHRYWLSYFKKLASGKVTPWDAKWVFTVWNAGGVSIVPNANLVRNIGFGADSTHTTARDSWASLTAEPLKAPYKAPSSTETSEDADSYLFDTYYYRSSFEKAMTVLYNAFWKKDR